MRRGLVGVGMLLSLSGCPTTNTVDDAAEGPDAGPQLDAPPAIPDAFGIDGPPIAEIDAYFDDTWFVPMFDTGPASARDAAARPDGATDVGPAPSELAFVIGTYDLPPYPQGPSMDEAPGLDLDGRVSFGGSSGGPTATCEDYIDDLRSPFGERGIDNQLVGTLHGLLAGFISDFDLQRELDDGVATGERVIAVRLHDLDDYTSDGSVTVDLFLVTADGCSGEVCGLPDGVVLDARWVARTGEPLVTGATGEIVDGRLHVSFAAFPLSFGSGGTSATLLMRDAVLEADVTATSLEDGVIAGATPVQDLVDLAESIMPGIGETARGILEDMADLSPSAADPLRCDDISAGMAFTAQRAVID